MAKTLTGLLTYVLCVLLQGPGGLKGGEGPTGVAGAVVSVISFTFLISFPFLSFSLSTPIPVPHQSMMAYEIQGHIEGETVFMEIMTKELNQRLIT